VINAVNAVALAVLLASVGSAAPGGAVKEASLYSLETTTLAGQKAPLSRYAGTVTLVVNVASQCGYTPQYTGLQKLHDELQPRGFSVLGFPSNDFGEQEPGSPDEIQAFCRKNYGVTFPMFSKVVTRAGPEQSPVYSYLGRGGDLPKWNFSKYLVGRDGKVIAFFPSKVTPESKELRDAIEGALAR
jgi:glutathione peroxidase